MNFRSLNKIIYASSVDSLVLTDNEMGRKSGRFVTHLNDFKYESGVLEIILQWKMYLSNILAWLRAINIHVNHWHTSVLKIGNNYLIKWMTHVGKPYSCIIFVLVCRSSTGITFSTRPSWWLYLCTSWPLRFRMRYEF